MSFARHPEAAIGYRRIVRPLAAPHRRLRWLALAASGGCLFQLVGCISGLVPVGISVGESYTLEAILRAIFL